MARTPGRVEAGGDRAFADRLAAALRIASEDDVVMESLTHPFHSYPARTHPATARELIALVAESMPARGLLVDPFCGSGTNLVEARAAGLRAIGVDINPLAVLVSRAKTWTAPQRVRARLKSLGQTIAGQVLAAGKGARRAGAEVQPQRGPAGFDPNARNRRLAAWFAPHVRRELEDLARHIDEVARQDGELAAVLQAALSAILYKVSSRTSDTNATWVKRNVARGASARWFLQRVELLHAGLADLSAGAGPTPEIFEADMRSLADLIPAAAAHAVVTSPPYAGTYDYAEHQRLRFDFLGLRHRHFDEQEIGARRMLVGDRAGLRWRTELGTAMDSISRMLAPGGLAVLVIGDSVAAGRAFHALDDVRAVLTSELSLLAWASQSRPMLGAAERSAFFDRDKAEHLILLRKA
jgi:SAM-dependent methyltransferase